MAMRPYYEERIDKQIKIERWERFAFCFIELPQKYLSWSDDSSVE